MIYFLFSVYRTCARLWYLAFKDVQEVRRKLCIGQLYNWLAIIFFFISQWSLFIFGGKMRLCNAFSTHICLFFFSKKIELKNLSFPLNTVLLFSPLNSTIIFLEKSKNHSKFKLPEKLWNTKNFCIHFTYFPLMLTSL